jgi:hypothetical protein
VIKDKRLFFIQFFSCISQSRLALRIFDIILFRNDLSNSIRFTLYYMQIYDNELIRGIQYEVLMRVKQDTTYVSTSVKNVTFFFLPDSLIALCVHFISGDEKEM